MVASSSGATRGPEAPSCHHSSARKPSGGRLPLKLPPRRRRTIGLSYIWRSLGMLLVVGGRRRLGLCGEIERSGAAQQLLSPDCCCWSVWNTAPQYCRKIRSTPQNKTEVASWMKHSRAAMFSSRVSARRGSPFVVLDCFLAKTLFNLECGQQRKC